MTGACNGCFKPAIVVLTCVFEIEKINPECDV
jgi:hypothetical protein